LPEFWIPYGDVEIVVNIKRENLGFYEDIKLMEEPKLSLDFVKEDRILVAFYKLLPSIRIFLDRIKDKDIYVFSEDKPQGFKWVKEVKEDVKCKIFVNQFGLDPIFGFNSSYSSFFRLLKKNFSIPEEPKAGVEGDNFKLAKDSLNLEGWISVELLPSKDLVGYSGDFESSYQKAKENFLKNYTVEGKRVKGLIVSPGPGYYSSNLSLGLKALWNILPSLDEDTKVILVCEALEGLGSKALENFVMGKKVEGDEDINFLKRYSKREIILISTLPKYYTQKKLGFHTFDSLQEAVNHLGNRKFGILPFAYNTLLK